MVWLGCTAPAIFRVHGVSTAQDLCERALLPVLLLLRLSLRFRVLPWLPLLPPQALLAYLEIDAAALMAPALEPAAAARGGGRGRGKATLPQEGGGPGGLRCGPQGWRATALHLYCSLCL